MKIFRLVMLAALALGLGGVAHATAVRVLDPSSIETNSPNIYSLNTPLEFTFYTCPSFVSNTTTDPVGCFSALNYTGNEITSLAATITATTSVPGGLTCPTGAAYTLSAAFTGATCSASGDTLTFDFTGGDIAPGSAIWIIEDGMDAGDFPEDAGTFTLNATPEPSSLMLTLTGMSSLGYAVRRRYRGIKS